ncbi:MAG: sensor signal transduction histidine kinase, partial [Verrucomicrobiaceae bacterium]|nr:sensor signal transduction histidine kinase [Verrucomicrobiaceae bacterium]
ESTMNRFRNLPIRRKFTVAVLFTCSSVLVLALAALFVFQSIAIKTAFIRDLSSLGGIVAHDSVAAAAFNDREAAVQTLSGLKDRPEIEGACLVLDNGKHVVQSDGGGKHDALLEESLDHGHICIGDQILFASPVVLDGKRLGTLYLRADFRPTRTSLLNLYASVIAVVLIASMLLALVLASRFQTFITAPILHLAEVVHGVGRKGNYSLRAAKTGSDEVGILTDAFNEMLGQIQHRDAALECSRSELENRVAERTEELAAFVSMLNATLDSTADGIVAVSLCGKVVCYNAKFALLWGIPQDMLATRDCKEIMPFVVSQVRDSEQFIRGVEEFYRGRGTEAFDVIELKDDRTFERYIQPQRIGSESVGMVANFRDITERKRAEAELEKAYRQLLETSRQAGMAEIATNVLHNVGNVLNSVNVSAGIVVESVKQSRVSGLTRVVALLAEHEADLGEFITHDARGRHVPAHLAQLSDHLITDQKAIVGELESLRQNVEHIKEIVAMQQSYARVGGVKEMTNIVHLVEDSLRINKGAFSRHQVEVVREFEEVPPMNVEKHKILQILVNLLRNAKHACQDFDSPGRRLTVRVANYGRGVKISVIDNGIGISADNLTRIFNHGFTTRKDGHGFGLHSGALAAREMEGSLSAHSDGPGLGATFTLELPCITKDYTYAN